MIVQPNLRSLPSVIWAERRQPFTFVMVVIVLAVALPLLYAGHYLGRLFTWVCTTRTV